MSHDQALEEFRALFEAHVAPEFASDTPIISLLQTKGVKVFVPSNWDGINGVDPLHLDWKPGLPESMKPRARPVNPKLFAAAKMEFHRLLGYFYRPSTSSIASCLVIAPKATAPFIRFCGDYVGVNKYISIGHYPTIPHVQRSLEKIQRFYIFLDFDLVNAFHQIRLHPLTAARLSVQTPWGQVEPVFMPEGVGPASGHLQKVISSIFADFEEWVIVIFDNLLVLATDYQDAYRKTELILDRCIERNVYLKFSKTWLGFKQVNFFGYVCRQNRYELSDERKAAINAMVFPKNIKQMQSFLGSALFFSSFVPHYSTLAAPLHDMVHKTFNWADRSTWTQDYEGIFARFKEILQQACALYYPDYSLPWILRTDASLHGVGAVLMQLYTPPETADKSTQLRQILQPIAFASAKFSPQATKWSTIEQEGYAVFFGVKSFSYYLTCKDFVLETDHANLLWMEASAVPKIVRWRVFLQSFSFLIRHIPGKDNALADWLSRMHASDSVSSQEIPQQEQLHAIQRDTPITSSLMTYVRDNRKKSPGYASPLTPSTALELPNPDDNEPVPGFTNDASTSAALPLADTVMPDESAVNMENAVDESSLALPPPTPPDIQCQHLDYKEVLSQVHGGRMGHHGTRRTWKLLNECFPGHRIPYRLVDDFVSTCPACQKLRLGLIDTLTPRTKTLHPSHHRSAVGADTLTITPTDARGNKYLLVVVNHMTKYAYLYPLQTHDARTVAECMFHYFCTFGLVDCIVSDPGSEFDNDVLKYLNEWFGVRHQFSLVDRHESNGVEGTNKLLLRHLTLLVHDERIVSNWSAPHVLPLIQYFINSFPSSEAGVVPLHAHFGSDDATYMCLPDNLDDTTRLPAFIKLLDDSLRTVRAAARQHHQAIFDERTQGTPASLQNIFQPGDLVLFQNTLSGQMKDSKLSPIFLGPYKVIQQRDNDVECKHLTLGTVKTFHVSRLKIFHGTFDAARRVALLDGDQHELESIIGYIGDPAKRLAMQFLVRFKDGDELWLPWSKDITDTTAFEDFCRTTPGLQLLVLTQADANKRKQAWKAADIDDNMWYHGRMVYCDLRTYGHEWYNSLSSTVPNLHTTIYLVPFTVGQFCGPKKHIRKKVQLLCPLFDETYDVDNVYLQLHTLTHIPKGISMSQMVIDHEFCVKHKAILPSI